MEYNKFHVNGKTPQGLPNVGQKLSLVMLPVGVSDCVCVSSRRRSKSKSPVRKEKSPVRLPVDTLTPEERDARTVFCMQLAARIRPRDLEDFFSAVGNVRLGPRVCFQH